MSRSIVVAGMFVPLFVASSAFAETIIGVREADGHLISFDSETPGYIAGELTLTNFPASTRATAIDFSASSNTLFVVGQGPTSLSCQLYKVNTATGAVTPVGSNRFTCNSITADIDINPFNNNVRFIGSTKVFDVNTDGKVVQLPDKVVVRRADAAYPAAGDFSSGKIPDIRDMAYDHNTAKPAANTVTLFAIDELAHTLVRVGPDANPIDGLPTSLTTIGTGLGAGGGTFDISGKSGIAFMFDYDYGPGITQHGNLYTVNLVTGVASMKGKVGTSSLRLSGMTVVPSTVFLGPAPNPVVTLLNTVLQVPQKALTAVGQLLGQH